MKLRIKETVFVFDLDDTLYNEIDYHTSGLKSVASCLKDIFDSDVEEILNSLISHQEKDLWGGLCKHFKLPESVKESLLWQYRLHNPKISLTIEVRDLLEYLLDSAVGVAIITDGRFITQKKKLCALKIDHVPSYISEEFGALKPDPVRFRLIENQHPRCRFVYIGDNPKKDFIAPNQLGWITIGVRDNGRNIHSQDLSNLGSECLPHIWLSSLNDLRKHLC
ncbi:MAG: HAD family hydrolase [Saccharospirillum sp.]